MTRFFEVPAEEQTPSINYRTPETWNLDITPLEYARRILYFVQRTPSKNLLEIMQDANVHVVCDAEGAKTIYNILVEMLIILGVTDFANEEM